jgi:hypothetical protein
MTNNKMLFSNEGGISLNDFAGPMVASNHFVKASFAGFAGSGKTRTGSEFAIGVYKQLKLKQPILIIDNEKGSRFLIPKFRESGIEVRLKETVQLADVQTAMKFLALGDISVLFIDSLTKIWYKYIKDYLAKTNHKFMQLDDWGKILPAWQEEFSNLFVECHGNIIFTGRGGYEYTKEEDEIREDGTKKKGAMVRSGVKMKMAGETPFEPDLNVWMELEQQTTVKGLKIYRSGQVMKSRLDSLDGKLFKNPTYKDFKPIVDYLLSMPTGSVSGPTSTENIAPAENFDWMKKREQREIEMEKIKAIFDKLGLGTSKEEKAVKVILLEKFFGTSSGTEMEKMNHEKLASGRIELAIFLEKWTSIDPEIKMDYLKSYNPETGKAA